MSKGDIREVLVLNHTHTDVGYTHPQPIFWELSRRFIDQAIDQCESMADAPAESRLRWTCEVTQPLRYWLRHAPSRQIERFRALVKAGLIGAGGLPYHVAPLVRGAQLQRMLAETGELRQALGLPLRCAIGHDINGLPWPTVGLIRDAGMELLIMGINIVFGGYPLRRPGAFRWRGPDRREVLCFNGEHYAAFNREGLTYALSTEALAAGLAAYMERAIPADWPLDFIYLTATHSYFVDNNPPELAVAHLVRRWNQEGRTPRIRYILPEELLARLEAVRDRLAVHSGDWTDYWNFGAASSATETRVNRQTRVRLTAAELIAAGRGFGRPDGPRLLEEATWHMDAWEEHTWGASASVGQPYRDGVLEQWNHKAHFSWQARSLSSLVLRDELELLAGNPAEGVGVEGLLLVNSTGSARREFVRVANVWLRGVPMTVQAGGEEGRAEGSLRWLWQHHASSMARIDGEAEMWDSTNSTVIGPFEVPAYGYATIPTAGLTPAAATAADCGTGAAANVGERELWSPHYALRYDVASGRVLSVKRRADDGELTAPGPWGFFDFVREVAALTPEEAGARHRGRERLMQLDWKLLHANVPGWKPDWPARRAGAGTFVEARVEHEPDAITLVRRYEAPGTHGLTQRIRLLAGRAAVECLVELDKTEVLTPEAIYFAFPLALSAGWRGHYDTADTAVEFDAEQLPGVSRDYVTVGQWACMHDASLAVTLACPDAPLVMFGGFHFGQHQASVPRPADPLLLAFAMNNYWMTNFRASQPGMTRLRWVLSSGSRYSADACAADAALAATPVEVHPMLKCGGPSQRAMAEVSGAALTNLRPAGEGGCIAHLVNLTDQPTRAEVCLPGRVIASAQRLGEGEAATVSGGAAMLMLAGRAQAAVRIGW